MRPGRAARGHRARKGAHGPSYVAGALAAVLALGGVAGCGGGSGAPQQTGSRTTPPTSTTSTSATSSTSPSVEGQAAQWASGVCAAVAAWEASIRSTRPEPTPTVTGQSPSEQLRGELRARLHAVAEATDQLRSELERLGPPQTAAGTSVEEQLSALSARLKGYVAELQDMATAPVGDVQQLQAQAAKVRDIVSTALTDVQDTVDHVRRLDPAGELATALATAPACEVLRQERSSGTPTG